jgi:hypothetical protein
MVHPVLAAKALVGSGDSEGLMRRVLGPPADALGETLARWVEFRTRNVGCILEKADDKLGSRRAEEGEVPFRIAGAIFEAGSYCDSELMAEYLGGVLASSRTVEGRDDRGARWVGLITGLSSYEIRMHYLFYATAHQVYRDAELQTMWGDEASYAGQGLEVLFDLADFVNAMEFGEGEDAEWILGESHRGFRHGNRPEKEIAQSRDSAAARNLFSPHNSAFSSSCGEWVEAEHCRTSMRIYRKKLRSGI